MDMKRFLLYVLLCSSGVAEAAGYEPRHYDYSIRSAGQGNDQSVLVEIECTLGNPSAAAEIAAEYAVHGIIFSGSAAGENLPAQQPLVRTTLTEEQTAWFDVFFREKRYRSYVVSVARGSMRIAKVKKRFAARVVVAVDKACLRRDLERAGIIEKLGAVFENRSE